MMMSIGHCRVLVLGVRVIQHAKWYSQAGSVGSAAHRDGETSPLMDTHGRRHNYLRISLTERCNLRCKYCMPAEGVALSPARALLSRPELVRLVHVFAALGVDKLRLTGGEPTLRRDLPDLIQELKGVAGIDTVCMTSNGVALTRQLPALLRAGLDHLNVSLDSLRADRYERLARRPALAKVLAGIDLALQLGCQPLKVNVVLMKGINDDELCDFVEFTRDRELDVRFIEFMPFSGNAWERDKLVPTAAALAAVRARYPTLQAEGRGTHDTATVWRAEGHRGRVGFISSMTEHFCGGCNRLRLTADGGLKVCLFGADEVSLRDALRSGLDDQALEGLVRGALHRKKAKHAGDCTAPSSRRLVHRVRLSARGYCTAPSAPRLTHLDAAGRARMVDVGHKAVTARAATATARVRLSARGYCTAPSAPRLTHLDAAGRARMVDVGHKAVTARAATATARVRLSARGYCTAPSAPRLTHLDAAGRARMVDVGHKAVTARAATATARVRLSARGYCTAPSAPRLTHLDAAGRARMVDVGHKAVTARAATATARVRLSARGYCTAPSAPRLTHLDAAGRARMVDVGHKAVTARAATATARVRLSARGYCTAPSAPRLTHLDAAGRARMVDVGHKAVTARAATATARVRLSARGYCTAPSAPRLTHLDAAGRARMVDVGHKAVTARAATATARVRLSARGYCTAPSAPRLTHLDAAGRARMVDVGHKAVTARAATATARVRLSATTLALLRQGELRKGDAVAVAETAGVMAAKRAADLLPLCHPLALHCVRVVVDVPPPHANDRDVTVQCTVRTEGRTGAEMEALTGAAVAALALYDMCKSADKNIVIHDLRLLAKSGGSSDLKSPTAPTAAPPTTPSDPAEPFAPTNFMYL